MISASSGVAKVMGSRESQRGSRTVIAHSSIMTTYLVEELINLPEDHNFIKFISNAEAAEAKPCENISDDEELVHVAAFLAFT